MQWNDPSGQMRKMNQNHFPKGFEKIASLLGGRGKLLLRVGLLGGHGEAKF